MSARKAIVSAPQGSVAKTDTNSANRRRETVGTTRISKGELTVFKILHALFDQDVVFEPAYFSSRTIRRKRENDSEHNKNRNQDHQTNLITACQFRHQDPSRLTMLLVRITPLRLDRLPHGRVTDFVDLRRDFPLLGPQGDIQFHHALFA